jgi:hypothetical protein
MAFVDIGVGTAMLYGAGIGAAAGGIYAGATGKNVLNGALIGGAGGALLGGGAAGIAGASFGGLGVASADATAVGMGYSSAAEAMQAGVAAETLGLPVGTTAAQLGSISGTASAGFMGSGAAPGVAGGVPITDAALNTTAATSPNAAISGTNAATSVGTSDAATTAAKQAMLKTATTAGTDYGSYLKWGIPTAALLYGSGIFGNNVNNQGITSQSTVGRSQPVPGIMSASLSPNYQRLTPYNEGGIARLATGGTGMTPNVNQTTYNPADVNAAQSSSLSPATQALLNQYGINPTQATNALSALQSQGIGTKTAAEGGIMGYSHGGSAEYNLGSYSDGGRLLKGPGDGMSDEIPATIAHKQPARLAEGEFVVPADVVSHLGNGSTEAGAKHLYKMMDNVRHARTGKKKQAKQIKADKFLPKTK